MDSIAPYSSAVAIRILVEFRSALSARFADPAILEALSPLILVISVFFCPPTARSEITKNQRRQRLQYGQVREPRGHWRRKRSETQRTIALATAGRFGRGKTPLPCLGSRQAARAAARGGRAFTTLHCYTFIASQLHPLSTVGRAGHHTL